MNELQKLLENAGVQINETIEDVIQPVADAIVYAYQKQWGMDGPGAIDGMNDFDRLDALKDIAEEARHRAGDMITGTIQ